MTKVFLILSLSFLTFSAIAFDNSSVMTFAHPQPDAITKVCSSIVRVVNEAESNDPFTGILSARCEGERVIIEAIGLEPVRKKTFHFSLWRSNASFCENAHQVIKSINQLQSPDGTITASMTSCVDHLSLKFTVIRVR